MTPFNKCVQDCHLEGMEDGEGGGQEESRKGVEIQGQKGVSQVTICDEREEKSPLLEVLPGTFSNSVYSLFPVVKRTFAHSN